MRQRQGLFWAVVILASSPFCASAQPASQPAKARDRQAAKKELRAGRGDKPAKRVLPAGIKSVLDVEYARVGGKPLRLDLYLPEKAPAPLPVIVFIHGGAWRSGDKSACPIVDLAGRGYGIVSIDYRLTDKAVFPAQIHDCKGAIRWVRAHSKEYMFDPDRVGVWGNSAGGHLVALLGTSGGVKELEGDVGGNLECSSRVQAVADFCGPTSLRLEDIEGIEGVKKGKTPSALVALLGGTVEEKPELARLASPTTFVTPDDPPFFIAHGEQDRVVPVNQARILAAVLKKTGVETTLHIDPKADHGVGKPEIRKMAEDFFNKHFKVKSAATGAAK
jgi:acetyl esterase/lipase